MRGRVPIAIVVAALLALASIAPARAHATLVASDPPDGAVMAAPPAQLVLGFNEPVSPLVLRLIRPDGSAAVLDATARDASIAVPLPALGQGTHVLSWRAVSLDGHPVGGSVVFSVGAPSAGPDPTVLDRVDSSVAAALWLCKLVLYLGLFLGVGGSFFRAWLAPRQDSAIATIFVVLGLVAAPIALELQGADALGVPLDGLARAPVWRAGLETSFGLTAIAAAFALLAGLFALQARGRVARGLALFGRLAVGLALALSGHAGAAAPQWLTRPAVFVHAVTVAFWVGSLVPLAAALRGDAGAAVLAAFSRAIPWALAPLVASGAVLAVIQVEQPELLLGTAYGRLLCAKLLLVALLLMLAAWNRYRLTPAIARNGDDAPRLRRTIGFELALVAAILGVVAAWRFTPPPRALAIAAAQPAFVHIHTAEAMAEVTLQPGRAGLVRADIIIMNGEFGGLDAREVALTFDNAAAGIEPISRPARKGADAIWRVEQFPIPRGGRWNVRVDILVNDFEKLRLDGQIDVRAK